MRKHTEQEESMSTELNERTTQLHREWEMEVIKMNSGNEWMDFLDHGIKKAPYLKSVGRLKKRPKVTQVSAQQRRIING